MNRLQTELASPEEIFEIINEIFIGAEVRKLSEQRISERKSFFLPIELQFASSDLELVGEPFDAVTRDLSVGGLGIISPVAASSEKAIVKFKTLAQERSGLLIDIRYSNSLGPFFQIGGRFCADWSSVDFC